jgi:hypothetical protein
METIRLIVNKLVNDTVTGVDSLQLNDPKENNGPIPVIDPVFETKITDVGSHEPSETGPMDSYHRSPHKAGPKDIFKDILASAVRVSLFDGPENAIDPHDPSDRPVIRLSHYDGHSTDQSTLDSDEHSLVIDESDQMDTSAQNDHFQPFPTVIAGLIKESDLLSNMTLTHSVTSSADTDLSEGNTDTTSAGSSPIDYSIFIDQNGAPVRLNPFFIPLLTAPDIPLTRVNIKKGTVTLRRIAPKEVANNDPYPELGPSKAKGTNRPKTSTRSQAKPPLSGCKACPHRLPEKNAHVHRHVIKEHGIISLAQRKKEQWVVRRS